MERSAIHVLAKRGTSQRAIARELGISRVTVARVLAEPVDRQPARRAFFNAQQQIALFPTPQAGAKAGNT